MVLRERRSLARDGVVVVCATADDDGRIVGPVQVAGSGFMEDADAVKAFRRLAEAVEMDSIDPLTPSIEKQSGKNPESRASVPSSRIEQAAYDCTGGSGFVTYGRLTGAPLTRRSCATAILPGIPTHNPAGFGAPGWA